MIIHKPTLSKISKKGKEEIKRVTNSIQIIGEQIKSLFTFLTSVIIHILQKIYIQATSLKQMSKK